LSWLCIHDSEFAVSTELEIAMTFTSTVLILVGGVFLLAIFSAFLLHRRSVGVAEAKRAASERRDLIVKESQQLEKEVLHELLAGRPSEQVFPDFINSTKRILTCAGSSGSDPMVFGTIFARRNLADFLRFCAPLG
jgi:hypothetical protein